MDNIDITDSAFSLLNETVTNSIVAPDADDSSYLYVGIAVVVAIIGFIVYKIYYKANNAGSEDCEGGFCTMDGNNKRE